MNTQVMTYALICILIICGGRALAGSEGNSNTFYGKNAGNGTTGDDDDGTFIGATAGFSNTTGDSNTFLGYSAGVINTTGDRNTLIGVGAGVGNSTGSGNVFLGYQAGYNETGSNKLYVQNSNLSTPLIYGEFDDPEDDDDEGRVGIGTTNPAGTLDVNGTIFQNRISKTEDCSLEQMPLG